MANRLYQRAPITEAIIDLQVKQRKGATLADVECVRTGEEQRYVERREVAVASVELQLGADAQGPPSRELIGIACASQDHRQVFQSRLNGFTFSRLTPYESWEPFCGEARRLWTIYRERVKPAQVTRLAVRYINRFDLSGPPVELKDFFRTTLEISPDLPQKIDGFFVRVLIPQGDLHAQLLINQTNVQSPAPSVVSVVLDIDLFRDFDVPNDEDSIWGFFEKLRVRKDEVFEACITDRARELIQ